MILGFKEFFDTKKTQPTFFRERIWLGVGSRFRRGQTGKGLGGMPPCTVTIDKNFIEHYNLKPKIHTFREDPHNRWKAGRKIQMVYRGKNYKIKDHFNDGIMELSGCRSTQKVEIRWMFSKKKALLLKPIGTGPHLMPFVFIDGNEMSDDAIKKISVNDGFDSIESFFKYFNKNFTGKIIHWTDLRY